MSVQRTIFPALRGDQLEGLRDALPDAWPTVIAGQRGWVTISPDDHALDVEAFCEQSEPITDGRKPRKAWRMAEAETWHGALAHAIPGRAILSTGSMVDLERAADAWLYAAGYDHQRPDVKRERTSRRTMLDYLETQSRADRVAYKGQARYRPHSHSRKVIVKATGREATCCHVPALGQKAGHYWADVTVVDTTGYDYLPASWPADLELPDRPWTSRAQRMSRTRDRQTTRKATEQRATAITKPTANTKPKHKASDFNGSAVPASTVLARESQMANMTAAPPTVASDAPTAVYGRLVTPWSASRRSLPRIVARVVGARDQAEQLEAILSTSQTGVPIVLNPQVTVRVYGALVDDGEHEPMPVSEWARRAAVAGVAVD